MTSFWLPNFLESSNPLMIKTATMHAKVWVKFGANLFMSIRSIVSVSSESEKESPSTEKEGWSRSRRSSEGRKKGRKEVAFGPHRKTEENKHWPNMNTASGAGSFFVFSDFVSNPNSCLFWSTISDYLVAAK